MDTPHQQTPWSAKVVDKIKTVPADRMAKLSIIAAMVVIGLNFAEVAILKGSSSMLAAASVAGLAAVLAGLILATTGLIKAWKCSANSVIPVAVAGLLLNGVLIATGIVRAPVLGRQWAKGQTVILPSGRKIITEDWIAGNAVKRTSTSPDRKISDPDVPPVNDSFGYGRRSYIVEEEEEAPPPPRSSGCRRRCGR